MFYSVISQYIPDVLCLVGIVHPTLQEMKWHRERGQAELLVETKFFESEKVLPDIFGEVSTKELLTAVVESTGSIGTDSVGVERRTLRLSVQLPAHLAHNLPVALPSEPSCVHASLQV